MIDTGKFNGKNTSKESYGGEGRAILFKSNKRHKQREEKEILALYAKMFSELPTGMSRAQADEEWKKLIGVCKQQAVMEGTTDQPENFGDFVLKKYYSGHPFALKMIKTACDDGATIEDLRVFWNLPDLSRRMILMSENVFRVSEFLCMKERGLPADRAMVEVRSKFPMYGNPEDTSKFSGDDRPLAHELRGRVDAYRERHGAVAIVEKVRRFSSFNAFVRDELRKGNL